MSPDYESIFRKQRQYRFFYPALILIVFFCGIFLCWQTAYEKELSMRNELLLNTAIVKNAIDINKLLKLHNDSSDLKKLEYQDLKNQFSQIRSTSPQFRFAYILRLNNQKQLIFVLDSENESSTDNSPPGQVYSEANKAFIQVFETGKSITIGPYKDRWGQWITALIPLKNNNNNRIEYVICIDSNAADWYHSILKACILPILISILFLIILIYSIVRQKRSDKEKQHLQYLSNSLKYSETKYRKIFENIQDVFFQVNTDGIITEISPSVERYSGYNRNELKGKNMEIIFFSSEDQDLLLKALYEKKEVTDYELRMKNRNGKRINASVNAHLLYDETENCIGIEGSIRDISIRKEIEDELRKTNEELTSLNTMKDKFFSIIAHDIKNPFSHILGFASLLKSNASKYSSNQIEQFSEIIHSSATKTYNLLEELLSWSMSQSGKLKINKERIALTLLCEQTIQQYTLLAQSKAIKITTAYSHISDVFIDKPTIETVIRNLLNNAIKFTHQNGEIIIKTVESNGFITLSIIDNGIGIEAEDIEKLFRIDLSTKNIGESEEKGTGFGLILCKEFVEKNGGVIGATSEFGKGSSFYFSVPTCNQI